MGDYFNDYKKYLLKLRDEVDKMVYGLTKEEVGIVEMGSWWAKK